MPAVDGLAAAALMQSWDTCRPGYCLHYVWTAYKAQGARSDGDYPTALSAWLGSSQQVPGDMNPPAGFPVYLGARAGSNAGDVVISLGDGMAVATDWPRNGVIGVCSIRQRIAQTGRPYLGWTRDILGNPIFTTPPDMENPPMALPQCFAPNQISWPNGYSNSYPTQVWEAINTYCQDPNNPGTQWVRDTFIREN